MTERVLLWGIEEPNRAVLQRVATRMNWGIVTICPEPAAPTMLERIVAVIEGRSLSQASATCKLLRQYCTDLRVLVLIQPSTPEDERSNICCLADDYLRQPFSESEVQAIVSRLYYQGWASDAAQPRGAARICWGPLELRFDERILLVNGAPCELTPRQERLLSRLIRAAGSIVKNEELWADFGLATAPNLLNIRVHVHALRKRLGAQGALIVTYPSVGYGIGVPGRSQVASGSDRRKVPPSP